MCIGYNVNTITFYLRDLNICRFSIKGFLESILHGYQGTTV